MWTEEEKKTMAEKYPFTNTVTLAKELGRTTNSVFQYAHRAGLKKDAAWLSLVVKERLDKGALCRFKPGHVSHNKGKKIEDFLSADGIARMKAHSFKKGNLPHNTKYDGYERISKDGYIEVRVALKKFIFKHRLIWEAKNGAVPKGHAVVFRDGDKRNFAHENLELITRQELMERNTIHRLPPELKSTIRVLSTLKKRIREKQD